MQVNKGLLAFGAAVIVLLLVTVAYLVGTRSGSNPAATTGDGASGTVQPGAAASGALPPGAATSNAALKPATHFVDPANHDLDIGVIRDNTEPRVTIDGRYSQAIVSCGTGCVSYWIVDRDTGGIIDLPAGSVTSDVVYDVRGHKGSNVVDIVYGPAGLEGEKCTLERFTLSDGEFERSGEVTPIACP